MPAESHKARQQRVLSIAATLDKTYPDAHCELLHRNPFELLVATILSAQCTDRRVNMVTPTLFQRFPTPAQMAAADPAELESLIQSTGFFRSKARSIREASLDLLLHHNGQVPPDMDALTNLRGVGRKTANVVLGDAFQQPVGIVVDTHVRRLSQRLALTKESDPVKIERALMRLVPQTHWTKWSHWLIFHGRRRCPARTPDCAHCEIATLCPSSLSINS